MSSIQPIATSRVTDSITRGRLAAQIQQDQRELFDLQNQLSTGRRLFLPSDDAASAQRAIELQRTLERRDQSVTNLQGARDALNGAEASLANIGNQLNELRAEALGAVDTIANDEQRQQLVNEIDALLRDLVQIGNSKFTGSFLFGGTETNDEPFAATQYVEYLGDEGAPQTFVDIGRLFESALPGDEVFGGISEAVRGSVDLDPQPDPSTRLSQINGGAGVADGGAIELVFQPDAPSAAPASVTIDLSTAHTLGDVARLIEAATPNGVNVTAEVSGDGLRLTPTDGEILVREVAEGSTASELGILQEVLTASLDGAALNPTLRVTTPLSDLGGTKARGLIELTGANNDLSIVATTNGASLNGLTVDFVDGAAADSETAAYDDATNTLTVTIADGESTADAIAAAINASDAPFVATTDYRDQSAGSARGTGEVSVPPAAITGVTSGGSGESIDLAGGLRVTNGGEAVVVDTSDAETVEDLLNLLNRPELGLAASINDTGDGLDVRSRRSGADFAIGENGGSTATDLGIRSYTEESRLEHFNRGAGVIVPGVGPTPEAIAEDTRRQNEFTIVAVEDGATTAYSIDVNGVLTVGDLIDAIDQQTAGQVNASLADVGNGLTLIAADPDTPATASTGAFTLGADTLTITATATGEGGDRPFTVEVFANNGGAPLATSVTGDAITVDLGGAPATTAEIAQAIEAAIPGYTVTSSGADSISADAGPLAAATTGGAAASVDAVAASGGFTLNGDTLDFQATTTGAAGDATFTINIENNTTGGLSTSVSGGVITVELGGADSTTDAIAASISAALPGYTVASDGNAAVLQADVGTFNAAVTGGRAADSLAVSGAFAERLGFAAGAASETDGSLTSADTNPSEVDSVFTTLMRMRDALLAGEDEAFGAEVNRLGDDLDRVSFGRSDIGVRVRTLTSIENRLADEEVELRSALSREIDADLVEVISDYTAQQASLQASLQTSASLLQLSILNFI